MSQQILTSVLNPQNINQHGSVQQQIHRELQPLPFSRFCVAWSLSERSDLTHFPDPSASSG
jgi:hypothetical protein